MLVLSRKAGEQIVLPGFGVTIQVLDIGKTKVRLGIAAPDAAAVHRVEVWERICRRHEAGAETEEEVISPAAARECGRGYCAPAPGAGEVDVALADWIARQTGGSIPSLSVELAGDRVVMSGSTG